MARFAQYYIKYHHEFAPYDWEKRQEHLGALFERDESIIFGVGEPSEEQRAKGEQYAKTYNHRVYHLQNNPAIIVMQFANSIDIPVEKNFGPDVAKDEPSCFVIIDNRDNLRTVAIQKRKKAFGNPGQVARILTEKIDELLYKDKCYKMEILPEFYPEDLFEAWELLQRNAQEMRFGVPDMEVDEIIKKVNELKAKGRDYFDDSLINPLLQLAVAAKQAKYKQLYRVMPEDKQNAMYVDKTSTFMKNLVTLSSAIDMPIEIVTKDGASFRCYVDSDEDNSDRIINREFDATLLEQLFSKKKKDGERLEPSDIARIEGEIVELLNGMKHESEDDEGGEQVA